VEPRNFSPMPTQTAATAAMRNPATVPDFHMPYYLYEDLKND
jgi:hypothetical protein